MCTALRALCGRNAYARHVRGAQYEKAYKELEKVRQSGSSWVR